MGGTVDVGNASVDGATDAGLLPGQFAPPGEIRHGTRRRGEVERASARSRWATGEVRATLRVLVEGCGPPRVGGVDRALIDRCG
ncbi:hypothetical protein [Micromonospora sp. NPDC005171]|uniref:hypothetical protein n=1 Tax=Micromonospora sp. NPDC005171 TaxID=3156866 RepID=UPI0033A5E918